MPDYIVGLDLGQTSDPTALCVLKRSIVIKNGQPVRSNKGGMLSRFAVVHLQRFPLMTAYPDIVEATAKLINSPQLRAFRPRLAVDATGVGRAVMDMFIGARDDNDRHLFTHADLYAITITAGADWTSHHYAAGVYGFHVPKVELASTVQACLGSGRLEFANLPDKWTLEVAKKELKSFKVKVTRAGNDTFEAREGDHDDIVLSIACGTWLGSLPRITHRTYEDFAMAEETALSARKPLDVVLKAFGLDQSPEVAGLIRENAAEQAALKAQQTIDDKRAEREHRSPSNPIWWN